MPHAIKFRTHKGFYVVLFASRSNVERLKKLTAYPVVLDTVLSCAAVWVLGDRNHPARRVLRGSALSQSCESRNTTFP